MEKNLKKKMNKIDESWKTQLSDVLNFQGFKDILEKVKEDRCANVVFPPDTDIFNAFSIPIDSVKVVILGQDPYHGEDQAHGLSFSVQKGVKIPPSLINIFKEAGIDHNMRKHGDLTTWLEQGVFLLNTTLTVRKGSPASHASFKWSEFTKECLQKLVDYKESLQQPLVFLCWGRHAQVVIQNLNMNDSHCVIKTSHPSPLGYSKAAPIDRLV